jgi:hypothetical protein
MVAVLAAVLVMAASIWIAIFLELHLGRPSTSCRACHVWPTTVSSGWCWPPRCGPRATTVESGFVYGKHPHALVVYRKADD